MAVVVVVRLTDVPSPIKAAEIAKNMAGVVVVRLTNVPN